MSELKVNKISPRSGTDVTLGDSGDTFTLPTGVTLDASNATTTLPATVVTTTGSQTLTNKSIDASQLTGTITPSDNTVSLAKLTATGTKDATTFLRGDNTFAEAGGGAYEKLVTTNITSGSVASVEFNSTYITSAYRDYRIVCSSIAISANDELQLKISDDNGSSYKSTNNYAYGTRGFKSSNSPTNKQSTGNSYFVIVPNTFKGGSSDKTGSFIIDIFDPLNTTTFFTASWRGTIWDSGDAIIGFYGGGTFNTNASSAFNAFKLDTYSSNLTIGAYTLYGRKI